MLTASSDAVSSKDPQLSLAEMASVTHSGNQETVWAVLHLLKTACTYISKLVVVVPGFWDPVLTCLDGIYGVLIYFLSHLCKA